MNPEIAAVRRRLRTPRAAAVAGILFAVLFSASMLLIRLVLPEELAGPNAADWLEKNTSLITLALTLVPFAGIAFLWFMGVVRSHLGELEDQLFSTVMFGSALLFLGMIFVSAALAVLTLLAGVFMLAAGLLKLGFLTRFISNAVLRGFLTGIGVNIILSQLGDLTGYSSEYSNKVVKAIDTLLHLDQINPQIFLVGIVAIVLIVGLDRVKYLNKAPLLIGLVVASALVPLLNLTTVPLVSSLGAMPETLPPPCCPICPTFPN
jgi:MFS superfamily sulfate permease-like transporter